MRLSTPRFRKKRKLLVKELIKYKDNEDKYIELFKDLQELYYKYKIKKYQDKDIINELLTKYIHSIKLKTLKDIKHINKKKQGLITDIKRNTEDIDDIVNKIEMIFSILESNKIVVEDIQEEIKFIKNVKAGISKKMRSKAQTFKLKK